jgi:hypothetical protein
MSEESWYLAVLVLEASVGDEFVAEPLLDLQYHLVRAAGAEDAYRKALELGRAEEHAYENPDGEIIRWSFAGLHDLRELDDQDLVHGAEVYSSLRRAGSDDYVVSKDQLTEFFLEANRHKTAREIMDGE